MKTYLLLFLLLASTRAAFADGGRLRFREPAGPFIVTLFTTPDPLSAGQVDFSVAVERPNSQGIVQDADVTFLLQAVGGGGKLMLHASHAAATSQFLQAANFTLPHKGLWRVTVAVRQGKEAGTCSGEVEVLPAYLVTNGIAWEIAVVPLLVLLFFLHQWRKRSTLRVRELRQGKLQA
jgi:hypothetical protein